MIHERVVMVVVSVKRPVREVRGGGGRRSRMIIMKDLFPLSRNIILINKVIQRTFLKIQRGEGDVLNIQIEIGIKYQLITYLKIIIVLFFWSKYQ